MTRLFIVAFIGVFLFVSCKKNDDVSTVLSGPSLVFKFKFDSTQARLNNFGEASIVTSGNAALSPRFNTMSSHYVELTESANVALGQGQVLYRADETTAGGENAIDFKKSVVVKEGEAFLSVPISKIKAGNYQYLRVSLAYQNYDVDFLYKNPLNTSQAVKATGTLASFIGFNNYIETFTVKTMPATVNANKKQGYWAFETLGVLYYGQAAGTTVVNPIASTSPIPAGSCVVTGEFANGLTLTGKETQDIVVEVSLSTNKSFEWKEVVADGKYQPDAGETVVDMGIRGMVPSRK